MELINYTKIHTCMYVYIYIYIYIYIFVCVCVCVWYGLAYSRDPKHCNLMLVTVRPHYVGHTVLNAPFKAARFCLQNALYEMFHSPSVTHEHVNTYVFALG